MSGFRVRPYLHAPSSTGVTVLWFSHTEAPGRLTVTGPGAPGPMDSAPEVLDVLAYTDAERAEHIAGLAPGSWLHPEGNVRHAVVLTGLRPDTRYDYTVTQGGEQASATLRTAPTAQDWSQLRIAALADSETTPAGRLTRVPWEPGPGGEDRPESLARYPLTKSEGYRTVADLIAADGPDLILMPGDLVGGGGYQPAWDEFFAINHAAGGVLSQTPLLPALGNWENFGGLNGRYGTPSDRSPVVRARRKYHAYFPGPVHSGGYYRIDHGPLTILTLDSSNGEPDDDPSRYGRPLTGRSYRGPGTDTQRHFTRDEYAAAGGTDLSDIGPGSQQWRWLEEKLRQARAQRRIVLVQFHHSPYSSGMHGLPMDHESTTGQGGTPMRRFQPMFRRYGVVAVICGHSELFERSVVADDGDAHPGAQVAPASRTGVLYYDVGIAGDSLGGERRHGPDGELLRYNPYRVWTADQDACERWEADVRGNPVLVGGGKHYGYLDLHLQRTDSGALLRLQPVHAFPVLNDAYRVQRIERRTYDDEVTVSIGPDGRPDRDPTTTVTAGR